MVQQTGALHWRRAVGVQSASPHESQLVEEAHIQQRRTVDVRSAARPSNASDSGVMACHPEAPGGRPDGERCPPKTIWGILKAPRAKPQARSETSGASGIVWIHPQRRCSVLGTNLVVGGSRAALLSRESRVTASYMYMLAAYLYLFPDHDRESLF